MQLHSKTGESFIAPYRFSNLPEALARFAFPFPEDSYMYSVNLEPHVRVGQGVFANAFDIDEHYVAECSDRARALAEQPGVHYVSLSHMMQAQLDVLELIMESYARDFPQFFELRKQRALDLGEKASWP